MCLLHQREQMHVLPGSTRTEVTVAEVLSDIKLYFENFPVLKNIERACPNCSGYLIGHGTYRRYHQDWSLTEKVPVQRMKCKECFRTFSIPPLFLLPHFRHSSLELLDATTDVIFERKGIARSSEAHLGGRSHAQCLRRVLKYMRSALKQGGAKLYQHLSRFQYPLHKEMIALLPQVSDTIQILTRDLLALATFSVENQNLALSLLPYISPTHTTRSLLKLELLWHSFPQNEGLEKRESSLQIFSDKLSPARSPPTKNRYPQRY